MSVCIIEPAYLLPVPEYGLLWAMRAWTHPDSVPGGADQRIGQLFLDLRAPAAAAELDGCLRALWNLLGRPLRTGFMGDGALSAEETALLDTIGWQALRHAHRAVDSLGLILPRHEALTVFPRIVGLVHTLEAAELSLARLPCALRQAPGDRPDTPTAPQLVDAARAAQSATIHLPRRVVPA